MPPRPDQSRPVPPADRRTDGPGDAADPGDTLRVGPVEVRPIGYVRSAYRRLADTPIQTARNAEERGRLVVLDAYAAGLEGLEGFDYAHLVSFLDRAWLADDRGRRPFAGDRLRPVPFLLQGSGQRVGSRPRRQARGRRRRVTWPGRGAAVGGHRFSGRRDRTRGPAWRSE